ncbi:MAG: hypothetical protein ACREXU_18590 [Gammaproteobacteria bacterium]
MTRALLLFILIGILSACATPAIHEHALTPKSTAAQTPPPPCRAPEHLVRDLTVPWRARVYVIGPCPLPNASAVTSVPEAPAGLDLTNTEIRDP